MQANSMTQVNITNIPEDTINCVLQLVPIPNLVGRKETVVNETIDRYIKKYINEKLMTDLYTTGYLKQHPLYANLVTSKLEEFAGNIAHKYVEMAPIIIFDKSFPSFTTTSLEIKFKYDRVGSQFKSNTQDFKYVITNMSIYNDGYCVTYHDGILSIEPSEKSIADSISELFAKEVQWSDTTTKIVSMEIVNKTYPEGYYNIKNIVTDTVYQFQL